MVTWKDSSPLFSLIMTSIIIFILVSINMHNLLYAPGNFFYAAHLLSLKRMQAPARKSEIQPFRDGVAESLDRLVNILRRHKHGI